MPSTRNLPRHVEKVSQYAIGRPRASRMSATIVASLRLSAIAVQSISRA